MFTSAALLIAFAAAFIGAGAVVPALTSPSLSLNVYKRQARLRGPVMKKIAMLVVVTAAAVLGATSTAPAFAQPSPVAVVACDRLPC